MGESRYTTRCGEVQPPVQRRVPLRPSVAEKHAHLAVLDLPQPPAPLPLHPAGFAALLGKGAAVHSASGEIRRGEHQHRLLVGPNRPITIDKTVTVEVRTRGHLTKWPAGWLRRAACAERAFRRGTLTGGSVTAFETVHILSASILASIHAAKSEAGHFGERFNSHALGKSNAKHVAGDGGWMGFTGGTGCTRRGNLISSG